MKVIVTRPEREAQDWVRDLRAAGLAVQALPLIVIEPAPDLGALQRTCQDLRAGHYRAAMFVSANAVLGLWGGEPGLAQVFQGKSPTSLLRAWAPGPGTRQALLDQGVDSAAIDSPDRDASQFDSESLWQTVKDTVEAGQRVLVVRGGDARAGAVGSGREWLAQRLAEAGVQVDYRVVYQRACPAWDASQQALARSAASDGSVWLFSSSEAIHNLQVCLPGQCWSQARALATHPRIAQAARAAGFGVVRESRPALDDIRASIESFQ